MQFPELGFYRHYKHDASKDFNNYSYEVFGIAWHTEDEEHLVMYRPLYGDRSYLKGAGFGAQPVSRWMEDVEAGGVAVPRFTQVTDSDLLIRLKAKRDELYGA